MKALTVKQPWAWAIIHGGKNVENRTVNWSYRGPLAIHAGKALDDAAAMAHPSMVDAMTLRHITDHAERLRAITAFAARGALLGVVDLVDVHGAAVGRCCDSPWGERGFAASGYGVVHLVLANPRPFAEPIWCKGRLGLWHAPDALSEGWSLSQYGGTR